MGYIQEIELKQVEYVAIKVELERVKTEKLHGLFLGYKPLVDSDTPLASKEEVFLWLLKGEQVHIINLNHYKVVELAIGSLSSGRYIPTLSWLKETILTELVSLQREFISRGHITDKGLIDVSKYKDVPASLKAATSERVPPNSVAARSGQNYNGYNNAYGGVTTTVVKKISTSIIKRTTRYDATKAIEEMDKKIQLIREGEYTPPKLKPLKVDTVEKKAMTQSTNSLGNNASAHDSASHINTEEENDLLAAYGMLGTD